MPQPSQPPNRTALLSGDGRVAPMWQQWFTQMWRGLVAQRAFYIPTSDGVPSFTPEVRAGFVPMAYDTANNDLYVYNGSWVKVTLS